MKRCVVSQNSEAAGIGMGARTKVLVGFREFGGANDVDRPWPRLKGHGMARVR